MRARYPNLQNDELEQNVDGVVASGSWTPRRWRAGRLPAGGRNQRGIHTTGPGAQTVPYANVNGEAVRVPWQEAAIRLVVNC